MPGWEDDGAGEGSLAEFAAAADARAASFEGKTFEETVNEAPPKTNAPAPTSAPEDPSADEGREEEGGAENEPDPNEAPDEGSEEASPSARVKLKDGTEATEEEIAQWREAHARQTQQSAEAELTDLRTRAKQQSEQLQYLLANPDQYNQIRQKAGLAPQEAPGIDPVRQADTWKMARMNEYVQAGWTDLKLIQQKIDEDHRQASIESLVVQNQRQQEAFRQLQQETALAREERQIARTLEPLYTKYPRANSPENRELVNDLLIAQVHRGQQPNFEATVKKVHDLVKVSVGSYIRNKRHLAAVTAPVDRGGGGAPAPKKSAIDKLPDTVESFDTYASMKSKGKA